MNEEIIYAWIEPKYTPEYTTPWAAWWDLRTRLEVIIPAHQTIKVPTWLKVKIPEWYMFLVEPRSSTLTKKWLLVNVWVIDSDFRWEIQMVIHNLTDNEVRLEQWERVAQWIIVKVPELSYSYSMNFDKFDEEYPTERKWWFGSTWNF